MPPVVMSEGPCNTRARSFKARTGEHELLDGLKQRWRGLGADNNEFQNDGLQCAGYHIAKHDEENAIARAGITDRSAAIRRTCSEAAAQLHAALPGDGSSDILRREARTAVVDPSPSTSAPSAGEVPPPFKPWRTSRHPNQKRPTQHGSVDQRPPLAQQPCRLKHYQPDERRLYEQQPLETQQQQQELRRIGVSGPRSLYRSESAFPALFLEQIDGDSADRPSDHADVAGGLGGRQQLEESVGRTVSLEQSALEALAAPFKVPHTPPRALVRETVSTVELSARGDAGSYAGGILGEEGDGAEEGEREFTRHVLGRPYAELEARYEVAEGELGRGKVGVLRACRCRATGRQFACKTISKAAMIVSAIVSVSDSTFPIARIACKAISKAAMIVSAIVSVSDSTFPIARIACKAISKAAMIVSAIVSVSDSTFPIARIACKTISKAAMICEAECDEVRREVQMMQRARGHPRIVSMHEALEDARAVHIIMELCHGGELFHRIVTRQRYSEPAAASVARQLASALAFLHARGVAHRDVKPENILLCSRADDTSIKLTDFGAAALLLPGMCSSPPISLRPFPSAHSPPPFPSAIPLRHSPPPFPSINSLSNHRDVKPENILLCSRTDDTSIKLTDFGAAALLLPDRCFTPPSSLHPFPSPHSPLPHFPHLIRLRPLSIPPSRPTSPPLPLPSAHSPLHILSTIPLQPSPFPHPAPAHPPPSIPHSPFPLVSTPHYPRTMHRASTQCTERVGSPYYLAPEVLTEQYGLQADVWSAGVVLFVLLLGSPPFFSPFTCACFFLPKPAAHPFPPGTQCTERVGSPYYLAPEVLSEQYGLQADVWSAGVVLFVLLSGSPPFSGRSNDEIFQAVRCKEIDLASKPWPSISEGAKDLVRRMLTRDPEARITMKEVLGEWVGCLG
ncbi:unnamed protein product [Closterium sp. NIES-65]|nr:unnamed protein product [Closterium sp. NIES-65]